MPIATPRWHYTGYEAKRWPWSKSYWVFELKDGTEFRVLDEMNPSVRIAVQDLPLDYVALGRAAADMRDILSMTEREATARLKEAETEIRHLVDRAEANPDNLVPVLSADLEKAINMMMRFAQALGVMAQGSLYYEIQALAGKYKMVYRSPSRSAIQTQAIMREVTGDVVTAELNYETGKMEIAPAPGSDFEGDAIDVIDGQLQLGDGDGRNWDTA